MILLITALVWPVVILICILSFHDTIESVLKSADEGEIGVRGFKWRKSSQQHQADATPGNDSRTEE